MEYDVEIKPTKLVKGQGLERLLSDSNCASLGIHLIADLPTHEELQIGKDK